MNLLRTFVLACMVAAVAAQDPAAGKGAEKGPSKEVAEQIAVLKEAQADKKFAQDARGVEAIDKLLIKAQAGVDPKDQTAIVKALESTLMTGKLRPSDGAQLYVGAAAALGRSGPEGAKVLKEAYASKRFPVKTEWVMLRTHFLRNIGFTKDESQIKFLMSEAVRSPEPALMAAAGEALGNYEESKETVRKEIVSELLRKYGELSEMASNLGASVDAQNAQERLSAIRDKWNTSLGVLTKQNFTVFRDWQHWHNKNKSLPW
ncbi:MAG: hypothetical protein FJ301_11680 [Planctomycetes bacterium]|nr:hypothetical protein [Planctomycetota bacterium]